MVWNHNGSQWFLGIPWPPAKSSSKSGNIPSADPKEAYIQSRKGRKGSVSKWLCFSRAMFSVFLFIPNCLSKCIAAGTQKTVRWDVPKLSFPQSICRILSATLQATWYKGTQKDWNFKPNGHSNYMAFNSQSRCGLDIKTKILKVETENTLQLHYLMSKWSIIRIINHLISIAFNPFNHSKRKWECFTSEESRPLHSSPPKKSPGCCCTSCWSPWETRLMALQVPFSRSV